MNAMNGNLKTFIYGESKRMPTNRVF